MFLFFFLNSNSLQEKLKVINIDESIIKTNRNISLYIIFWLKIKLASFLENRSVVNPVIGSININKEKLVTSSNTTKNLIKFLRLKVK